MMKKRLLLLPLCLLALVLAGCGQQPQEDSSDDVPALSQEEQRSQVLLGLLSSFTAEEIGEIIWEGPEDTCPSFEEMAGLLNGAAAHPIDREGFPMNGSHIDCIWSLTVYTGDPDDAGGRNRGAIHLYTGLDENLVEIFCNERLPEGRVIVEDEALYQRVRTMKDQEYTIDQAAYGAYREAVDAYLARLPDLPEGVTARRELIGFTKVDENAALNAQAYHIEDVCIVDPPERAPHLLLAGGAYVDSQLRIHRTDWRDLLIVVDGTPVGTTWFEYGIGGLAGFSSKQELIDFVSASE